MMRKNVTAKVIIGLLCSGVFLALAVRNVRVDHLATALATANYLFLIPAVLLTLLVYWFRAVRWRYMLIPIKPVHDSQLFTITMIGFMANNILPVRIGELVRAYLLGKRENLSKSLSLGTVVVERLLDSLTIMSLSVPFVLFFAFPPWVKQVGIVFLVIYAGVISLLLLLYFFSEKITRVLERLLSPISPAFSDRIEHIVDSFCQGLTLFKSWRQVFWILVYSYFIWVGASLIVMLILYSFHFIVPLYAPFFMLAMITLGASIPSSPGFVGTLQFFCVAGLAFFGIPEGEALGFSIVYHASQYVPITVLGLFFMWKGHLRFKELPKEK